MEEFANWGNGASAKEVQEILRNNFKSLKQQIVNVSNRKNVTYEKVDLKFNLNQQNTYTASIVLTNKTLVSIKFYDNNNHEIYFSYSFEDDKCYIFSDILPNNTYCEVIYYD